MTVCVGAICKSGSAVVVCADRMLSYGPPMSLQAEGAVKKIYKLSDSCVLLFSGVVPDGEEILKQALSKVQPLQSPDIADIADIVGVAYKAHKQKRVEDTILRPLLGVDFSGFQKMVAQSASSQILGQVLGMISQHNLQTDFMIAGLDKTGAHMFLVAHPGNVLPVDTVGTASIGSGGMHAAIRMSLGKHEKDHELARTIYGVHEAKLAAEIAPGVGQATDMAVINGNGITFVTDPLFKALKKIHKERPLLTEADVKKIENDCKAYDYVPAK